jgi:timeless
LQEQNKLRDNALQQAAILMDYKRTFCQLGRSTTPHGLCAILVGLLAEPFSRVGNARTDADHLTIELVLYLFRNLLLAEPLGPSGGGLSRSHAAQDLHCELVTGLGQELVLEIVYVVCADIEQRENNSYNLLLMEFIQLLFKHHDPILTAQYGSRENRDRPLARSSTYASSSLKNAMQREKLALQSSTTSRHSHFGGTFLLEKENGQKQVLSAAFFGRTDLHPPSQNASSGLLRRSKHSEPFLGAKTPLPSQDPFTAASLLSYWQKQSTLTIHQFCSRFLVESKCYGPLMKSLKNEFRRDTVRLEDNDRIIYFQVITFLSRWWRTMRDTAIATPVTDDELPSNPPVDVAVVPSSSSIGQLIFTMDVFSFNLVFNAIDTFLEHKKYGALSHSVALLREMMHLLNLMQSSSSSDTKSSSSTEHMMAMGLMDRLFYGSEPLDRLPKLLARWTPGTSTREYVSDLVEITHITLELLDRNRSRGARKDATHDTVEKMNAAAAEFDVDGYFARRIVSNHTVAMYTHLLSHYATNGPAVNKQILAFFERLCQFTISFGSNDPQSKNDEDWAIDNPLAAQTVTLEPMLYNASFLLVLHTILQDRGLCANPETRVVAEFATRRVQCFARAANSNPVLFVEALFSHPFPHRFCDLIANLYVTEDLRMFVERDLLLQQQYQLEQQQDDAAWSSDSSDDELEFTDAPASTKLVTRSQPSSRRRTIRETETVEENSDQEMESSDELEFDDALAEPTAHPPRQASPSPRHTKSGREQVQEDSDKDMESSDELEFHDAPAEPTAHPLRRSTPSPRRTDSAEPTRAEAIDASKEGKAPSSAISPNRSPRRTERAAALPVDTTTIVSLPPRLGDLEDDDVAAPRPKKARVASRADA